MFWNFEKTKAPMTGEKEVTNGVSILPENFQVPDFSFLKREEESSDEMRQVSKFHFEHRGKKYLAETTFVLIRRGVRPNILAKIDFDIKDEQADGYLEKVGGFHFLLTRGPMIEKYIKEDNKDNSFCGANINYRYINPEYRGGGLSDFCMRAIEEITKKISIKHPELNINFIEVYTSLASITRLLIDKQWLKDHGLEKYERRGENMGYKPDEQDSEIVRSVLEAGLSSIDQMTEENVVPNDIRLVKNI
ncbi:MAG TPA: hypothetical protein PKZ16_02610 [bacterium]|nr:hypothetical protein [bacterium]HPL95749.1 hypothetical protein [bacterium]